jgi:hypothetical protein
LLLFFLFLVLPETVVIAAEAFIVVPLAVVMAVVGVFTVGFIEAEFVVMVVITVAHMAISQTIGMVDTTVSVVDGTGEMGTGLYRL